MHDIFGEEARWHDFVREQIAGIASSHGFDRIETPVLEQEEVFAKGVGAGTDIVEKELYTLRTKGGDKLALRPEATAAVVRAYVEHGMKSLPQPVRFWYASPMFRHDRPQRGRFRQFWQAGFEILGEDDAVADAEAILVTMNALNALGLKDLVLHVNSIGDPQSRQAYKKVLQVYLRKHKDKLAPADQKRITSNPLRILDSKDARTQQALLNVPEIIDYLNDTDRVHFRSVLEYLEELDLPYLLNPRLVRGLDYYSRTVFEVFAESPGAVPQEEQEGEATATAAQTSDAGGTTGLALASGGRYDGLFRILGSKAPGGVGSAIGIERVVDMLRVQGSEAPAPVQPQVFLVQLGDMAKRKALGLYEELRVAGLQVYASFGRSSIKSQLRIADKLETPYVLILGQKEVVDDTVIIRSMKRGTQETVRRAQLVATLKRKLGRKAAGKKISKKAKK